MSASGADGGSAVPPNVESVVVGALALAALAAFSVAVPQTILLIRLARIGHPDAPWTLKTAAWTGTIAIAFAWRCAVFVDFAWFDQQHLGPISRRWGIEAAMALMIAAAVLYTAVLYHLTVTFRRRP